MLKHEYNSGPKADKGREKQKQMARYYWLEKAATALSSGAVEWSAGHAVS